MDWKDINQFLRDYDAIYRFKKQYSIIENEILTSIKNVLNHGQYIMGPEIAQLEKQLADFIGVKHAIVNSSGTDALLMALMALEIQPGDEVITTPFSFLLPQR